MSVFEFWDGIVFPHIYHLSLTVIKVLDMGCSQNHDKIFCNIIYHIHYVYTVYINVLFSFSWIYKSINRSQFLSIKSLNSHYSVSIRLILLKCTGVIYWAIENLHINFQVILRSFVFILKSLNFTYILS